MIVLESSIGSGSVIFPIPIPLWGTDIVVFIEDSKVLLFVQDYCRILDNSWYLLYLVKHSFSLEHDLLFEPWQ